MLLLKELQQRSTVQVELVNLSSSRCVVHVAQVADLELESILTLEPNVMALPVGPRSMALVSKTSAMGSEFGR